MIDFDQLGGPFETVLDVGGNVGSFAEQCWLEWPKAHIVSFEPIAEVWKVHRDRIAQRHAEERWQIEPFALSGDEGTRTLHVCENQHSASTMQPPGYVRRELLGIQDSYVPISVRTRRLDSYAALVEGRTLLKVDVEGHEAEVLRGAGWVLQRVETVLLEVNVPGIFEGSPSPTLLDAMLRPHGLRFAGVAGAWQDKDGRVLQFDGIWRRSP